MTLPPTPGADSIGVVSEVASRGVTMAKHTAKPHHQPPPKPAPTPEKPPAEVPDPDAPRPDSWRPPAKWFYFVLLFWVGGFLVLMLMLFAESLPLLWDLIRLKF
jgi:hypothetical protein